MTDQAQSADVIPDDPHCLNYHQIESRFGPAQTSESKDNTVNSLRHLHRTLKDAWRDIADFKIRVNKDALLSDAARDLKLAEYAKRRLEAAERKYEELNGAAEIKHAELDIELTSTLTPKPVDAPSDVEFRQVVRNMSPAERNEFINEVRQSGDLRSMRILANAHDITTGIAPVTRNHLKAKYLEATAPNGMRLLRQLEDGMALAEKAKEALIGHTYNAVNFQRANEIQENATD